MKIWRALWNVAAATHRCSAEQDPGFGIRRETPKGWSATWEAGEVVRLVKAAWRRKYLHHRHCLRRAGNAVPPHPGPHSGLRGDPTEKPSAVRADLHHAHRCRLYQEQPREGLPGHPQARVPGGHAAVSGHAPDRRLVGPVGRGRPERDPAEDGQHGGIVRASPDDLSAGQPGRRRAGGRGPEAGPSAHSGEQVGAKS